MTKKKCRCCTAVIPAYAVMTKHTVTPSPSLRHVTLCKNYLATDFPEKYSY